MGKKNYAKSPLLYIHQPNRQTPKAQMQHHYVTPKAPPKQEAPEPKKVPQRPLKRTIPNQHNNNENKQDTAIEPAAEEEEPENEEEEPESEDQERKKFKDMTLRERVDYFVNTPKYAPAMKCEVKTDERNYRGTIVDLQDETVFMRVGRRTSQTKIPFDMINEIRMIGF